MPNVTLFQIHLNCMIQHGFDKTFSIVIGNVDHLDKINMISIPTMLIDFFSVSIQVRYWHCLVSYEWFLFSSIINKKKEKLWKIWRHLLRKISACKPLFLHSALQNRVRLLLQYCNWLLLSHTLRKETIFYGREKERTLNR